MSKRAFTAAEQAHLKRASDYVDQAFEHHHAAVTAHESSDDRALGAAHRALESCLRGALRCFRDMAADAADSDIANTQTVQTSSGTKPSTGSLDGRATPVSYIDTGEWLGRAFGARARA